MKCVWGWRQIIQWLLMKHQPCTPEFVSTCPLPPEWSSAAQIQLVLAGMPDRVKQKIQTGCEAEPRVSHWVNTNQADPQFYTQKPSLKYFFSLLTSASLDDMNLSTTCLRYSKLISRLSLRSEVLVTVGLEVGGLGLDAGGRSGQNLSCFSARISGNFSFPSASGSGFSFYRA